MNPNQGGTRSAASRQVHGLVVAGLVSQRGAARLAWALTALSPLLLVLAVVLLVLNRNLGFRALSPHLLLVPGFGVVGLVLAMRRPGHAIGWLFVGMGLVAAVQAFAFEYAARGYATAPWVCEDSGHAEDRCARVPDRQDARTLRRWTRSTSVRAGLAQRPRIVLLAADGKTNTQIAATVGCSRPAVIRWHSRYTTHGLDGLVDQPRSGRPAPSAMPDAPRSSPPPWPAHPSALAPLTGRPAPWPTILGSARMTVARVWADHDLAPHRVETFKFSTDPELLAKVTDICGLYLEPPAR
jgi:hypothetical protein